MKCPRDGAELKPVRVGSIVLDKCHSCDGLWCDRGELEAIRDAKLSEVEAKLEEEYGNPEVKAEEVAGYMPCPRCEGRLNGVSVATRVATRVDRCDSCFGYWLDAGELDKALGGKPKQADDRRESGIKLVLRSVARWLT